MLHYADSSAWIKLVYDEAETEHMLDHLAEVHEDGGAFVSSMLMVTELHRAGARLGVSVAGVDDALGELDLAAPSGATFRRAGLIDGRHLRSLDALHVAAALEVGADAFVTYDDRQAEAARAAGIRVVAPGTMAR